MSDPKQRGILFSGPMVRATLDGRKTQTRRVVRVPFGQDAWGFEWNGQTLLRLSRDGQVWNVASGGPAKSMQDAAVRCPYGAPGDLLYVREAVLLRRCPHCDRGYEDEQCICPDPPIYRASAPDWLLWDDERWRPSIHMPKWAARIWLRLTAVRVERLKDINEEDAQAEGFEGELCDCPNPLGGYGCTDCLNTRYIMSPRAEFALEWDHINAKRGYSWDSNPWVWALTFERTEKP